MTRTRRWEATDDVTTKRLKNTREAIEYCGEHWHETTWRRWRVEGKGPRFIRLEGKVLYRVADLDAWIEAQAKLSTSDPGSGAASAQKRRGLREVAVGKRSRGAARRRATTELQRGGDAA